MDFTILHEFPPPRLEAAWRDCLSRAECPAHYDAPEFFLEPFWTGRRPFAVLALNAGAVAGALTGLHEGAHVTAGLPSRPQLCMAATREPAAALDALARGLLQEAEGSELVSAFTWASLPLAPFERLQFRRRQLPGNVVLDLTQGTDALFKQLDKKRRNNVRYALKEGVQAGEVASPDELAEAYAVYLEWRKTQRKEIRGGEMPFESLERQHALRNNYRILVARHQGRIIAGSIYRFMPGGLAEYSANFSLDARLNVKPNDLLQWEAIAGFCGLGVRRLSLGGAHLFLRQAGGRIVPILRYRLDRTWLRRHDLKEKLRDGGRSAMRKLPPALEAKVRRWTGHEQRRGD